MIRPIALFAIIAVIKVLAIVTGWVVGYPMNKFFPNNWIWGNREEPEPNAKYLPDKPEWIRFYMWHCWRNKANGMRYWFREPKVAELVNIEFDLRSNYKTEATKRFIKTKWFFEYWYLRRCDDGEYFEFRIGWKFGRVEGFGPTIQLRKGE